jgi:hypothetical protein
VYAQSFTVNAYPNSLSMDDGSSATVNVNLNSQYGFNGQVDFAATGLPGGVTASFTPNPTTYSTMLTLSASSTATPGTANVMVTGTSGSLSASTPLALTVNAPSFTVVDAPAEINLLPGSSRTSTIVVVPQHGFSGNVSLDATGLPSGVSATFSPNPAIPGSSTLMTVTASSSAIPGSSIATITGTAGALVATAPLVVGINTTPVSSSTTLAVTSGGSSATSAAQGAVVTLTATVRAGSAAVSAGQVNFCDTTSPCRDPLHLLGSAQLTHAGIAVLKLAPGMGSHSYKAFFLGTNLNAASTSGAANLTVTAAVPTTTTIAQSGNPGNYTLTATVTGQGLQSPAGTVSFLDTSAANSALGTGVLGSAQASLHWLTTQSPATGQQPQSVAVGDFNGDGIPDLAIPNSWTNSLTILLGNGDGTFTAAASTPSTGSQPMAVAVGDFNADGIADLAVANSGSNSLTILLGNGDGSFTPSALSPQTGYNSQSIAIADFNGDGIQDLAVANTGSNTLTILLGNGDGTFTAQSSSPLTGNNPRSVRSSDFNGDGVPDLVVANNWNNTLTVLLGNGDGTFTQSASPATGAYPSSIAIGDFDGNGTMDLAVANQFGSVLILLGNGDGTFTAASASPQAAANFLPFSLETSTKTANWILPPRAIMAIK